MAQHKIKKDVDFEGAVTVAGNLDVNGTTTTVNTANLNVTDKNITVNNGGNDASSEGAGITVARTGTAGSIIYANASPSRFKAGDAGSEVEIVNLSSSQTLTNKTLTTPLIDSAADVQQIATPSNPSAGRNKLYFKSDNLLYSLTSAGVETSVAASGGVPNSSVTSKTTTYTATSSDNVILVSAASSWTLSLPAASSVTGKIYLIVRTDNAPANSVTIDPNGAETIGGASTVTLNTQYESYEIISDGTNWQILNHKAISPWTSYTPTFTGLGTVSNVSSFWRRVGDTLEAKVTWSNGTVSAALASISLPSNISIDTAKIQNNTSGQVGPKVGSWAHNGTANESGHLITAVSTDATLIYFGTSTTGANMLLPQNGDAIMSSTNQASATFSVPISGWSA